MRVEELSSTMHHFATECVSFYSDFSEVAGLVSSG